MISHEGDCSIYAKGSDVCDCGAFRKAIRESTEMSEEQGDVIARHLSIAEPPLEEEVVIEGQCPDGIHLRLWSTDGEPIEKGWDALQALKNEFLGSETQAVEVFPPESGKVDERNMRHLFRVPKGLLPDGLHGWDQLESKK